MIPAFERGQQVQEQQDSGTQNACAHIVKEWGAGMTEHKIANFALANFMAFNIC